MSINDVGDPLRELLEAWDKGAGIFDTRRGMRDLENALRPLIPDVDHSPVLEEISEILDKAPLTHHVEKALRVINEALGI